jgi:hypothetical protein
MFADDSFSDDESDSATVESEGPHFLEVYQSTDFRSTMSLRSNVDLVRFEDPDDGQVAISDRTFAGNLDYPGDIDTYTLHLSRGESVNIRADSILIDPYITVDYPFAGTSDVMQDDDSGGGMFGLNAELTYQAPDDGIYMVSVSSSYGDEVGGYFLIITEPYDGAPTPMSPPPTATPITSDLGDMAVYESENFPFTIQYPAEWSDQRAVPALFGDVCIQMTACFLSNDATTSVLMILEEDLDAYGLGDMTTEEYVDIIIDSFEGSVITVVSQEEFTTDQGRTATVITADVQDGLFTAFRLLYVEDGHAFNAVYFVPGDYVADLEPFIQYSFATFTVTD